MRRIVAPVQRLGADGVHRNQRQRQDQLILDERMHVNRPLDAQSFVLGFKLFQGERRLHVDQTKQHAVLDALQRGLEATLTLHWHVGCDGKTRHGLKRTTRHHSRKAFETPLRLEFFQRPRQTLREPLEHTQPHVAVERAGARREFVQIDTRPGVRAR